MISDLITDHNCTSSSSYTRYRKQLPLRYKQMQKAPDLRLKNTINQGLVQTIIMGRLFYRYDTFNSRKAILMITGRRLRPNVRQQVWLIW